MTISMSQSLIQSIRERSPDHCLPRELRDDRILKVRDMSAGDFAAFQIVFDQDWVPFGYWSPEPNGWEMTHARLEYHRDGEGLMGMIRPKKAVICIVVRKSFEQIEKDSSFGDNDV